MQENVPFIYPLQSYQCCQTLCVHSLKILAKDFLANFKIITFLNLKSIKSKKVEIRHPGNPFLFLIQIIFSDPLYITYISS